MAQVVLASVIMLQAFAILLLITASNGTIQDNIQPRVNYAFSEVKTRSVLTSVMNGELWRSGSVNQGEYGNITAKRAISAYMSDGGIRIDRSPYRGNSFKSDIESYMKSQMESYFSNSYYRLEITSSATGRSLSVESDESLQTEAVSYGVPIALTGGNTARAVLTIEKSGEVYS